MLKNRSARTYRNSENGTPDSLAVQIGRFPDLARSHFSTFGGQIGGDVVFVVVRILDFEMVPVIRFYFTRLLRPF